MSTNWFPDFPGFAWGRKRAPQLNTLIQTSASGLEARIAMATLIRREWTLSFNYLREGTPWFDVESLEGVYGNQFGPLITMFFRDQYENSVTNGFIATGNGTTASFQLQRILVGGSRETGSGTSYVEPVFCVDTRGSYAYGPYTRPAALSPQAFVNATPTSATFNTETGILTFGAAPANGSNITATFSYGFRVRFSDDTIQFSNLFAAVNEMQELKLIQTRF